MADTVQITIIGRDQASAALAKVRGGVVDLGSASTHTGGLLSKLGGSLASLGMAAIKVAAVTAAGALFAFGAALKGGIEDARAHAQVMGQTEQTIKSMGNAAGVSARHVESFAASLSAASGKSLFGDDQIQAATNMLLTFSNIKGATLDLATTLSVDMAQALKSTPEAMSKVVGKILNSADAMSAAQRMGVSFSDEQIKLGKQLFETGHIAEYQALVMKELNAEFGGQAEAAAKADGGWAQFHDRLGEAAETMGTAVLPLLNGLAGVLNDVVMPVVETAAARFGDLIAAFQTGAEGGDVLGGFVNALHSLDDVSPVFTTIGDGLTILGGLIDDVLGEGGGIGVLVDDIREMTGIDLGPLVGMIQGLVDTFVDAGPLSLEFAEAIGQISPVLGVLLGVAAETLPQIQALVESVFGDTAAYLQENGAGMLADAQATWQSIHDTVLSLIGPLAGIVNAILEQIRVFWEANGQDILAFVGKTWAQINEIIQLAMQLIQATVVPVLQFLAKFINDHGAEIQAIFQGAWKIISSIIDAALTLIKGILTAALQIIQGDWEGAWKTIQEMSARFVTDILGVIEGGLQLIQGVFDSSIGLIRDAWNALVGDAAGIGNDIINGILNGLQRSGDQVISYLRNLASDALQAAKDALGISSPSRAFFDVGQNALLGLIGGIDSLIPDLLAQVGGMSADIMDKISQMGDAVHETIADAFDATASIDRQAAKNIDAVGRLARGLQDETQAALDDAMAQAQEIEDPERAAKFFKMRSSQILELARLQDEMTQAEHDGDTQHADELMRQIMLIQDAQDAERRSFDERQQEGTQIDHIRQAIADLFQQIDDAGGIVGDMPAALQQLFNLLNQMNNPGLAAAEVPPQGQGMTAPVGGMGMLAGAGGSVFGQGSIVIYQAPGQNTDQLVDVLFEKIRQRTGGRL